LLGHSLKANTPNKTNMPNGTRHAKEIHGAIPARGKIFQKQMIGKT
jgi:hypothetical protein